MTENSEHPLALPVGTELVGDYVITKVLGAGGFGITYEANERSLDRTVAIKEYFPMDIVERQGWALVKARSTTMEVKYARGLRRFIEEAKAITQFNHPNIVRVLRYFKTNNTAFMVLHYEDGVDMGVWRENLNKPPTEQQLTGIISPLLDALELIHNNDFLHRDIAPDNIIIRKDGSPILIDFGSARSELTFSSKTVSALVKSGYSPFEQYAKNSKEQGPWTDIYSFGATLYQMVTGEAPPDSLSRLAVDEIIPAKRRSKRYYSRDFLAAIDSALAIQIADRPQSIDEWRSLLFPQEAIDAAGAHDPQNPRAASNSLSPAAARTPSPSLSPGSLLKAGQTSVAELVEKAGLKPADLSANAARLAAKVKAPLLKLVPRTRDNGIAALPGEEQPALDDRNVDDPQIVEPVPPPRSLRSLLDELDHRYEGAEHEQIIEKAANPSGEKKKTGHEPKKTAIAALLVAKATTLFQTAWQTIRQIPWPDFLTKRVAGGLLLLGAIILAAGTYRSNLGGIADKVDLPNLITSPADLFASKNSALLKTFDAHRGGVSILRLAKGGKQLISTGADQVIRIWNMADGVLLRKYEPHDQTITALDLKGNHLVRADSAGNVSLFDLENSLQLAAFSALDHPVRSIAFVGTGDDLLIGADKGQLDYWAYKKGQYTHRDVRGRGHTDTITAIVSHKRFFFTSSADNMVKIWGRSKRNLIRTYRGHTGRVGALALSPKAYRLATGSDDGSIKIWSPRARRVRRTLKAERETHGAILNLAFAKNGKWLASGGADHTLNIWNARNGVLQRSYQSQRGAVRDLLFSSDGKRLVTANEDGTISIWDWNARPVQK